MNKSIFIIEDDTHMLNYLEAILDREGFQVFKYEKGHKAIQVVEAQLPDIILLDLMLPDISGLKLCKQLKENPKTTDIPVIMLTAKADEEDILIGFNFGCTDYITKPFNEKILVARIKASLQKTCRHCSLCAQSNTDIIKIDDLLVDSSSFEVLIKNKKINLTPLEFKLFYFLVKNQNRVFTRNQLFQEIYDGSENRSDRAIDILVNRIRNKIGTYSNNIESIYGIGYSFKFSKNNNL